MADKKLFTLTESTPSATHKFAFGDDTGTYNITLPNLFPTYTGNVGIGTYTVPTFKLELYGAGQTTTLTDAGIRTNMLALTSNGADVGDGGALVFRANQSYINGTLGMAAIKGYLTNGATNTVGDLAFFTRGTTAATFLTERMRILSTGNIGVGTAIPTAKFEVCGNGSYPILATDNAILRIFVSDDYNMALDFGLQAWDDTVGDCELGAWVQIKDIDNHTTYPLLINPLGGNVGIGTFFPNDNAVLDIESTTKAFMPPRMTTTQMNAIPSPTEGMVIYNTTAHALYFRNATVWGAV